MTQTILLEVWLGPAEGLSAAAQGSVSVGRVAFDKVRNRENGFVVPGGGVSGAHAEFRAERGRLLLRDLESTNGTFVAQRKVTSEVEIASGEIVLLSSTPLRVELTSERPAARPAPEWLRADSWAETPLSGIAEGATQAARQRREAYVDTRHVCDAVLRTRNTWVQRTLREAGWSREEALTELWDGGLFQGARYWLAEVLNRPVEARPTDEVLLSPRVASLFRAAHETIGASSVLPPETAVRYELLNALVADAPGCVGAWLRARGVSLRRPDPTTSRLMIPGARSRSTAASPAPGGARGAADAAASGVSVPAVEESGAAPPALPAPAPVHRAGVPAPGPAAPPLPFGPDTTGELPSGSGSPRQRTPPPAQPAPPPPPAPPPARPSQVAVPRYEAPRQEPAFKSQPVPVIPPAAAPAPVPEPARSGPVRAVAPAVEAGDPAVDQRARELASQLVEAAVAYRFAPAADRREALRSRVERELQLVPAEKRAPLMRQLRVQFPVAQAPDESMADAEVLRLRKQVHALERELAVARAAMTARPALPWAVLLGSENPAESDARVAALRAVLDFAVDVERLLLSLIQSVTMPGNESTEFLLPAARARLEGYLRDLKPGDAPDAEELARYLAQLERWQVALFAAHHEAPKRWFQKIWKRIAPAAIEAAPRAQAGWLGNEAQAFWETYRRVSGGLTPDVAQDQVLQLAAGLAREEYEKLTRRKG